MPEKRHVTPLIRKNLIQYIIYIAPQFIKLVTSLKATMQNLYRCVSSTGDKLR